MMIIRTFLYLNNPKSNYLISAIRFSRDFVSCIEGFNLVSLILCARRYITIINITYLLVYIHTHTQYTRTIVHVYNDIWFQCRLGALPGVLVEVAKEAKKMGKDDPRKVTHSLKVGLALTLVSLYYYFQPFYDGFGVGAMWAVLTVVLVFEFSVGKSYIIFTWITYVQLKYYLILI